MKKMLFYSLFFNIGLFAVLIYVVYLARANDVVFAATRSGIIEIDIVKTSSTRAHTITYVSGDWRLKLDVFMHDYKNFMVYHYPDQAILGKKNNEDQGHYYDVYCRLDTGEFFRIRLSHKQIAQSMTDKTILKITQVVE